MTPFIQKDLEYLIAITRRMKRDEHFSETFFLDASEHERLLRAQERVKAAVGPFLEQLIEAGVLAVQVELDACLCSEYSCLTFDVETLFDNGALTFDVTASENSGGVLRRRRSGDALAH